MRSNATNRIVFVTATTNEVEYRKAGLVGNDHLAVNQERVGGQRRNRFCRDREAECKIVAGASNEPNARTIAPRQNAETVMLDFVNPSWPGRRGLGRRGQARLDNSQAGAGTLTQRHGS
jgi:hypothetical protein